MDGRLLHSRLCGIIQCRIGLLVARKIGGFAIVDGRLLHRGSHNVIVRVIGSRFARYLDARITYGTFRFNRIFFH